MDFRSLVGKYLRLMTELTSAKDSGLRGYADRIRLDLELVERQLAAADDDIRLFADTLPVVN